MTTSYDHLSISSRSAPQSRRSSLPSIKQCSPTAYQRHRHSPSFNGTSPYIDQQQMNELQQTFMQHSQPEQLQVPSPQQQPPPNIYVSELDQLSYQQQVTALNQLSSQLQSQIQKLHSTLKQKRELSEHLENLRHHIQSNDEMAQRMTLQTMFTSALLNQSRPQQVQQSPDTNVMKDIQNMLSQVLTKDTEERRPRRRSTRRKYSEDSDSEDLDEEEEEYRRKRSNRRERRKSSRMSRKQAKEFISIEHIPSDDESESEPEMETKYEAIKSPKRALSPKEPSVRDTKSSTKPRRKHKTDLAPEDLDLKNLLDKAKKNLDDLDTPGPVKAENLSHFDDRKPHLEKQATHTDTLASTLAQQPATKKLIKVKLAIRFIRAIKQISELKQFRISDTRNKMKEFINVASISCFDNLMLNIHIPINSIVTEQDGDIDFMKGYSGSSGGGFLKKLFGSKDKDTDSTVKMQVVKVCAKIKAILDGISNLFHKSNVIDMKDGVNKKNNTTTNIQQLLQFCSISVQDYILYPSGYWLPSERAKLEFDRNEAIYKMNRTRALLILANFVIFRVLICKILTPSTEQISMNSEEPEPQSGRHNTSIHYSKQASKNVKLIRTIIYYCLLLAQKTDDSDDISSQRSGMSASETFQTVEAMSYYLQQQLDIKYDESEDLLENDHLYAQIYSESQEINSILSLIGHQNIIRFTTLIRNILTRIFNSGLLYLKSSEGASSSLASWLQYRRAAAKEKKQFHRYVDVVRAGLINFERKAKERYQ